MSGCEADEGEKRKFHDCKQKETSEELNELYWMMLLFGQEDCLFLNISAGVQDLLCSFNVTLFSPGLHQLSVEEPGHVTDCWP